MDHPLRGPLSIAILAGCLLTLVGGLARAQESEKAPLLSPRMMETIGKFTEEATKLRREQATEEMGAVIDELAEKHSLGKPGIERLEKAAEKAVEDSLPLWSEDLRQFLTVQMQRMAPRYYNNEANLMGQLGKEQAPSLVERFQAIASVRPIARKAWTVAMSEVLGEEALTAFQDDLRREEEKRQEEISRFLDDFLEDRRKEQLAEGRKLVSELTKELSLDGVRENLLEGVMEEAVAEHLKAERDETAAVLERTLSERWSGFASMSRPIEFARSATWKTGLQAQLGPDQLQKWNRFVAQKQDAEEKKFTALLEMSKATQREAFDSRMRNELSRLYDALELEDATEEKFRAAADEAIDAALEKWKKAGLDLFRSLPPTTRESLLQANRFQPAAPEEADPLRQPPWTEALDALLTPEQQAGWEAELALWEKEEAQRLEDMIDATADSYEPQFQAALDPKIADVIASLQLDEKRAKEMRDAGDKAVKQSLGAWKERAREWLDGLTEDQRQNYTEQGRVPLGYNESDAADQQPAWEEAFATILTAEERAEWERSQETRQRSRRDALAGLLVAQVEEWVGIDPKQWDALADLCREPAGELANQFNEQHYYMNISEIARVLQAIEEKEIRGILSESQWDRWRKAIEMLTVQNRSQSRRAEAPKDLPEGPAPLFVEGAITELIYERNRELKQEMLLRMQAEIEVCATAAALSETVRRQLITGGKGAVEEVVREWDTNFTRYVRQRARGANPRSIHQQLAGVGNYGSRRSSPLETQLWLQSLEILLPPEKQKTWEDASTRRTTERRDAIAAMVSAFFETRLGLGADQAESFGQKLRKSLATYGPDIERVFTSYNSPWYLQYYSIGMPLMGIPENELKELLSKEQYETWETQFRSNAANYWDNVESFHLQRMIEKQKEEQEAGKEDS